MAVNEKTFDLNQRAPSARVEEKLYNVRFKTDEDQ